MTNGLPVTLLVSVILSCIDKCTIKLYNEFMITIRCPECGVKNQTDKTPQPEKRYSCGKCGAAITYQQITANQDILNETTVEKQVSESLEPIATPPQAMSNNRQVAEREVANKEKISTTKRGISKKFLVIALIIVILLGLAYNYLFFPPS